MSRRLKAAQAPSWGKLFPWSSIPFSASFKVHFSVYYSLLIILCLTLVEQDFKVANHVFFSFKFASGLKEFENHFFFLDRRIIQMYIPADTEFSFPYYPHLLYVIQPSSTERDNHLLIIAHFYSAEYRVLLGFCKNAATIILLSSKSMCKPRDIVCKYSLKKKV